MAGEVAERNGAEMTLNPHAKVLLEAIENDMIVKDDNGMSWYWGEGRIRLVAAELEGKYPIEENGYPCKDFESGVRLLREYGDVTSYELHD